MEHGVMAAEAAAAEEEEDWWLGVSGESDA
jgi:hypothetical protein